MEEKTKFCKHCGEKIPEDAVICTKCGRQVEELKKSNDQQQIVINNTNTNVNSNRNFNGGYGGRPKNKWVSIGLCCAGFIGLGGLHKFYEGKIGMGILYLCTMGLFMFGTFIDLIALLFKPNPYYV